MSPHSALATQVSRVASSRHHLEIHRGLLISHLMYSMTIIRYVPRCLRWISDNLRCENGLFDCTAGSMYTVLSNTTFQINDLVTNLSPSRKRPSSYYCLVNSTTLRTSRNGQSLKVSNIREKSSRETGSGKESKPTSPNHPTL